MLCTHISSWILISLYLQISLIHKKYLESWIQSVEEYGYLEAMMHHSLLVILPEDDHLFDVFVLYLYKNDKFHFFNSFVFLSHLSFHCLSSCLITTGNGISVLYRQSAFKSTSFLQIIDGTSPRREEAVTLISEKSYAITCI